MAIKFKRKDGTIRVIRNAEYLSGFYFIPKEFLDKCSAKIRGIPRRPRDLLYNEQALAVVESDVFLEAIIDVYAYMVWPYMGLGRKMEIFSGDAPEWRYAHAAALWIQGLEKLGIIPTIRDLLTKAINVSFGYVSIAEAHELFKQAIPQIMAENNVKKIIACGRRYRCFEDFDYRDSRLKKDFYRKWYHSRTKHPSTSLEELRERFTAEAGIEKTPPDLTVDFEGAALSEIKVDQFLATLSDQDRQILELRLEGLTLEKIAKQTGYQNHSGVLKRLRRIGKAYEEWSGQDLGF